MQLPDIKGQRVLITGGLGFIGSNLAHLCLKLGAKVTIFDCLDPHSGGCLENVAGIKDDVELCFHDILNFDQITAQVINKDVIFHCAASTSHSFSMREPWLDQDVNSKAMINILEAVRRFNKDVKFVHLGTTTQLGKLQYTPADELHPEFPTDIYSANKSVSEKYALIYANAHNLRLTVLRLSNTFGPRGGFSPDFTFNNFFIGLALRGENITVYGTGGQLRNVIFVDDACSAMVCASQSDETNGQTYFAVGDNHYSVAEIAEATVEVIGKGKVVYIDWPAGREKVDVGDAVYSNAKIKGALNWKPLDDLKSGLGKTKEFYDTKA